MTDEKVTLTIDGRSVSVPKGQNLIEAAKQAGVDIPYYCYHPDLSIAGNCRMCQVQVQGAPKMDIACNTACREGMVVETHHTNQAVADTQAGVLEFLLINHPLDCTVCDQAGHCKLQDYHYDYNARPSRFLEEKVHKVKAEPLGPTVMLDGERCIACTRCIRFCDEVTGTSELAMLNRGDRYVISINEGRVLDNPLSGTVVDLCPVGALTHRNWRFNTRIWFTNETEGVCPGCSTGCNVRTCTRDGEVVQVKANYNADVNKEWLCDEGRYGFGRFLPAERVLGNRIRSTGDVSFDSAVERAKEFGSARTVVLVAPDLTLEEYALAREFCLAHAKSGDTAIAYRERPLTELQKILVSPDYAANFRGAEFSGLVSGDLHGSYQNVLTKLKAGAYDQILLIGDRAILEEDRSAEVLEALSKAPLVIGVLCDAASPIADLATVSFPGRSILEKSGLMINRAGRLQYTDRALDPNRDTHSSWNVLNAIAARKGKALTESTNDRELTRRLLARDERLSGLSIATIKRGGIALNDRGARETAQAS